MQFCQLGFVFVVFDCLVYPVGNHNHILFLHATRGQSWSAKPDAAWVVRAAGVEGHSIFVDGDSGQAKGTLAFLAADSFTVEVDYHQMVVGTASYKLKSPGSKFCC